MNRFAFVAEKVHEDSINRMIRVIKLNLMPLKSIDAIAKRWFPFDPFRFMIFISCTWWQHKTLWIIQINLKQWRSHIKCHFLTSMLIHWLCAEKVKSYGIPYQGHFYHTKQQQQHSLSPEVLSTTNWFVVGTLEKLFLLHWTNKTNIWMQFEYTGIECELMDILHNYQINCA